MMGLTLQGAGAIGSGVVGGFQSQRADNRAQNEEARKQTTEEERLLAVQRQEELNSILAELPGMLKPGQEQLPAATPGPQAVQPQAIPDGAAPAGGPPGGTPGINGGSPQNEAPPPGAGPGIVAGPPAGGQALPTGPELAGPSPEPSGAPAAEELSTMSVGGTADPTGPRDRIAALRERASKAAAASGGMQAMDSINKYFDMQVQGQMYDYATEGIRAVAGGSAGEAVRFLNTAMEIATVDPGVEFFAMNGEVYGQRGDGEPRKYSQEDLIGLTESYLMDPANYLAWQKQILDEKKADTDKTYKEGAIDVAKRGVEIKEGDAPYTRGALAAGATANLMNATANQDRAAQVARGKELGWDANNYLKINDVAKDLLNEGKLGTGSPQWASAMIQNPQLEQQMLGGVVEIVKNNDFKKVNYQYAAMLSQIGFAAANGVPLEPGTTLPKIKQANGEYFAQIEGIEYWVPASIYLGIQQAKMANREQ